MKVLLAASVPPGGAPRVFLPERVQQKIEQATKGTRFLAELNTGFHELLADVFQRQARPQFAAEEGIQNGILQIADVFLVSMYHQPWGPSSGPKCFRNKLRIYSPTEACGFAILKKYPSDIRDVPCEQGI